MAKEAWSTVHVERTIRPNKGGPEHKLNVTFDYSGCSMEEIVELATANNVITLQTRLRNAYVAKGNLNAKGEVVKTFATLVGEVPKVINVKTDIVDKARAPGKSAFDKAMGDVSKFTPEQAAALVAALTKVTKK